MLAPITANHFPVHRRCGDQGGFSNGSWARSAAWIVEHSWRWLLPSRPSEPGHRSPFFAGRPECGNRSGH